MRATGTRTSTTGPVAAAAAMFVAASAVAYRAWITTSHTEQGDTAADSIRTRDAWTQTSGIFSRWDFHHPGPVLFWLKAIGNGTARLIPGVGIQGGQALIVAAIAAGAGGLVAWALNRSTGRWLGLTVFPLLAMFGSGTQLGIWAPSVAHWAILAGFGATAATSFAARWALPVATFAGMAAVHLHVLYVAPGAAICVLAGVARWVMRSRYTDRRDITAASAIGGLMVLPLAVGVEHWSRYLDRRNGASTTSSWDVAARRVVRSVTQLDAFAPGFVVLGAAIVCGLLVIAKQRRDVAEFFVWCGFAWLAWLAVIAPLDFLTPSTGGPIVMALLVAPFIAQLDTGRISPAVGVVGVFAATTFGVMTVDFGTPASTADEAYGRYLELTDGDDGVPLVVDHWTVKWDAYAPAAGLTLRALREGVPVCVAERRWPYWAEPDLLCDQPPASAVTVTFFTVDEFDAVRP